jgi:hypothetical protein
VSIRFTISVLVVIIAAIAVADLLLGGHGRIFTVGVR